MRPNSQSNQASFTGRPVQQFHDPYPNSQQQQHVYHQRVPSSQYYQPYVINNGNQTNPVGQPQNSFRENLQVVHIYIPENAQQQQQQQQQQQFNNANNNVYAPQLQECDLDSGAFSLCRAAAAGDLNKVKELLSCNSVNTTDYDKRTALHLACAEGKSTVAELLISKGADVNAVDRWGNTPLREAVMAGHMITAQKIKASGGICFVHSQDAASALCRAASQGDLEMIRRYVVYGGVEVDSCDYDQRTALHLAASEGKLEIVKFLVEIGAKPNVVDRFDNTPLRDAVKSGHSDVANFLILNETQKLKFVHSEFTMVNQPQKKRPRKDDGSITPSKMQARESSSGTPISTTRSPLVWKNTNPSEYAQAGTPRVSPSIRTPTPNSSNAFNGPQTANVVTKPTVTRQPTTQSRVQSQPLQQTQPRYSPQVPIYSHDTRESPVLGQIQHLRQPTPSNQYQSGVKTPTLQQCLTYPPSNANTGMMTPTQRQTYQFKSNSPSLPSVASLTSSVCSNSGSSFAMNSMVPSPVQRVQSSVLPPTPNTIHQDPVTPSSSKAKLVNPIPIPPSESPQVTVPVARLKRFSPQVVYSSISPRAPSAESETEPAQDEPTQQKEPQTLEHQPVIRSLSSLLNPLPTTTEIQHRSQSQAGQPQWCNYNYKPTTTITTPTSTPTTPSFNQYSSDFHLTPSPTSNFNHNQSKLNRLPVNIPSIQHMRQTPPTSLPFSVGNLLNDSNPPRFNDYGSSDRNV